MAILRAGFARTDVTPPLGIPLGGYAVEDRRGDSIRDCLHAGALVLERAGFRVAIVSLDWIIVEQEDVAAIRTLVHAETGIQPHKVMICAIQTHSAPRTVSAFGWGDKVTEYIRTMVPRIAAAVVQASTRLAPIHVGIGVTTSDVGVNRRQIREDHSVVLGVNPWGPYDSAMTVVRFEGEDGPLVTLVHYGAHPTVLGGQSRVISRDWPGIMIDRMETLTGAPVIFINGAVGDVAPRSNFPGAVADGEVALYEVGTRATTDAMRVYRTIKEFRDLELDALTREMTLPYRPLPELATARQALAVAEPLSERWGQPMCDYRHWQAVVHAHEDAEKSGLPTQTDARFTQTILRLGPIAFVPFPGEPFAEIVLRLRHASPFQHTLCASTTNGSFGYFATRESLHRGGYEVWVARAFGPYILVEDIDDVLVEQNLLLLRSLLQQDDDTTPKVTG